MATLGDLVVRIVGDNSQLDSAIDRSFQKIRNAGRTMTQLGKNLTLFVTTPILGIAAAAVKSAADMEVQQAAFETLLGSAEDAQRLLTDLTDLAATTPFQLTDLAAATKQMLAFGIELEDVLPNVQMLGDIAQGDSERLRSLTLAFSQIQSTGRLMGQDLLQLINAGFNPLQTISELTGETMAELKDRMSAGAISAEEIANAFRIATSEGGRFYGGMARASQTLAGQISTLKDNLALLGREFAEILLPALKDATAFITGVAQRFAALDDDTKKIILTVAGLTASLGPLALAIGTVQKILAASSGPIGWITLAVAGVVALTTAIITLIRRNREYENQLYNTAEAAAALTAEEQRSLRTRFANEYAEALRERRRLEDNLAEAKERQAEVEGRFQAEVIAGINITDTYNEGVDRANKLLEENEERQQALIAALDKLDDILDQDLRPEIERTTQALSGQSDETENAKDIHGKLVFQLEAERLALRNASEAAFALWKDMQTYGTPAVDKHKEAVERLFIAYDETFSPDAEWVKIARELPKMLGEAKEATDGLGDAFKDNSNKGVKGFGTLKESIEQMTMDVADFTVSVLSSATNALIQIIQNTAGVTKAEQLKAARAVKTLGIFQIIIDTAVAIMNAYKIGGPLAAIAAGVEGAFQFGVVASTPLPALAAGGIVTQRTTAVVGEGGQPEVIFPLDQLQDFLGGEGGMTRVVVNLEGRPLIDHMAQASRNRELLIDARSVV